MQNGTGVIVGLLLIALGLGIYFLPVIVAAKREHNQQTAIGVLNLLLGWTLIGWVVALVWACTNNVRAEIVAPQTVAAPSEKTCPQCAETVKAAAVKCRFCGYSFDQSALDCVPSSQSSASISQTG